MLESVKRDNIFPSSSLLCSLDFGFVSVIRKDTLSCSSVHTLRVHKHYLISDSSFLKVSFYQFPLPPSSLICSYISGTNSFSCLPKVHSKVTLTHITFDLMTSPNLSSPSAHLLAFPSRPSSRVVTFLRLSPSIHLVPSPLPSAHVSPPRTFRYSVTQDHVGSMGTNESSCVL